MTLFAEDFGPFAPSEVSTSDQQRGAVADSLLAQLLAELTAAWERGERLFAEELLHRHPELWDHPESAVRLIYEEICLREDHGEQVNPSDVLRRFPAWRSELEVLCACHGLFQSIAAPPSFPDPGEMLGEFLLMSELGRGARGRVFLATQPSLADRPVVLKLTPREGQEHVSLARLQHTHIVPLYAMEELPERNLRLLCMPYLGGATLASILDALEQHPLDQWTGQHLLTALDQSQPIAPLRLPAQGPVRHLLSEASYVQAVCWIGACLAEALHYAHERGLVHLDLKPSNVLLAADGQPLLLDFHLAREPVGPGQPAPEWFGGTKDYMSPEQWTAYAAVEEGKPIPARVDGRSDLYSLGLVLYEALGGVASDEGVRSLVQLRRRNPQVSAGLADILGRCLAIEPEQRYPNGAALAEDLRRHLADLPLRGVANRSLFERWSKWRRRSPHALLAIVLFVLLAGGSVTGWLVYQGETRRRLTEARTALEEGRQQLRAGDPARALETLERGHGIAEHLSGGGDLLREFEEEQRLAERALTAAQLHTLIQRLGFSLAAESLPPREVEELESQCRALWDQREQILARDDADLGAEHEQRQEADLLDLAAIWSSLHVRGASPSERNKARREALQVLAEAERLFGSSPVLEQERRLHAEELGLKDVARIAAERLAAGPPRTARARFMLARALVGVGQYEAASAHLEQVRQSEPQQFWPHFYGGVCAYHLRRHAEAIHAFDICIALSPASAECYFNRGLVHSAIKQTEQALRDYDRALNLNPKLAVAAGNRGLLHYRAGRPEQAEADFKRALAGGLESAALYFNLALAQLACKDESAAVDSLRRALRMDSDHKEARARLRSLRNE